MVVAVFVFLIEFLWFLSIALALALSKTRMVFWWAATGITLAMVAAFIVLFMVVMGGVR